MSKSTKTVTPQSEAIPGREKDMKKNNAGGYVFKANKWDRLNRFLILGTEGGTYYTSEKKLTKEATQNVLKLIELDGKKVVDVVVDISVNGRAYKNNAALFVLALCASDNNLETRKYALANFEKVARTQYHKFVFTEYMNEMRGWGRLVKETYQNYFLNNSVEDLAYQFVKYGQREGWSTRDLLRLSKPKTDNYARNTLFYWAAKGCFPDNYTSAPGLSQIEAVEWIKNTTDNAKIVEIIRSARLPIEAIPSEKQSKEVWEAMVEQGGITWLFRNLNNLRKRDILVEGNFDVINLITKKITDEDLLKKGRIHPFQVLLALNSYSKADCDSYNFYAGFSEYHKGTEATVSKIVDSLNDAFYISFKNIEPTGKRFMLGVDVSGSMSSPILGQQKVSCAEGAAVMALATARSEESYVIKGFCHDFVDLPITPKQNLSDVMKLVKNRSFGGTDCSLPMIYAQKNKIPIDVFCVYTDNETWAGEIQPVEALRDYRRSTGIDSKLVVVGMTSTGFTIADPDDDGMLDLIGFDANCPSIISEFASGNI